MKPIHVAVGLFVALTMSAAQAATLTDCCDWASPAWTLSSYTTGGAGTASAVRETAGGNPGARLNITTVTPGAGDAAFGSALFATTTVLAPNSGSAFTLSLDVLSGPGASGQGQAIELLVEQAGTIYAAGLGVTGFPLNPFTTLSFNGTFVAANFVRRVGAGPLSPSFDGTTPTRFGFAAGNSGSGTSTQYYDNFRLVISAIQPTLTKAFSATTIADGATTLLTFTLTNPASNNPAQTVSFTDTLPPGLRIGTSLGTSTCTNPMGTGAFGGGVITITSATVPASTASPSSCTISVEVTNVPGQTGTCFDADFTNSAANISATQNVVNGVIASCVTVTPAVLPSLTKAFSPTTIASGGNTILTFTLTNPAPNNPARTVSFVDTLPPGLQIGTAVGTSTCENLMATGAFGGNTISVTSATVPASTASPSSCTISVVVTNVPGQTGTCPAASFTNSAANISGAQGLVNDVTASCVTVTPAVLPSLTKAFSPTTIASGGNTILTFTLTNPAPNNPARTVSFVDTLPPGLQIGTAVGTSTCENLMATGAFGGNTITVTTATVPASTASPSSCTISVVVTNVPGQTGTCPAASFTNSAANISGATNLTNSVAASCVSVAPGNTFTISKVASASALLTGSPLSYTINVTNNGPSAASGSLLTDPVIAGFAASSITCTNATNGAACPLPANVTLANLQGGGIALTTFPANSTITFVLSGTFTQTAGSAVNTATISSPPGGPLVTASSVATVTVVVPAPSNIPTTSQHALIVLMLVLGLAGAVNARRCRS